MRLSVCKSDSLQGTGSIITAAVGLGGGGSQSSQCVGKKQSKELKLRMQRQAAKRQGREDAQSELRACVPVREAERRYSLPCTCLLQRPKNDAPL